MVVVSWVWVRVVVVGLVFVVVVGSVIVVGALVVVSDVVVRPWHWSGSASRPFRLLAPLTRAFLTLWLTLVGRFVDVGEQVVGLGRGDQAAADLDVGLDLVDLGDQNRGVFGGDRRVGTAAPAAAQDAPGGGRQEEGKHYRPQFVRHRGDTSRAARDAPSDGIGRHHWPT